MSVRAGLIAAALFLGSTAQAQDPDLEAYVEANLLSIFYHEFGHALIDVMDLPVFGQEEDAADTFSVLLIDALYDEETAQKIAENAAFGFLDEAAQSEGQEPPWWDEHGPDLQRFYNLVCLFYGAAPRERQTLADDLGLPEERAAGCADEFDLANASWGPVLDELTAAGAGETLKMNSGGSSLTGKVITAEVAALNAELSLPETVEVRIEACDEANAFYDLEEQSITMCLELEPHLNELYDQN